MPVHKSKRKESRTEHMNQLFIIFDMVDNEIGNINYERYHFVCEPVGRIMSELIQLSIKYESVGKKTPQKIAERNVIIVAINQYVVELWDYTILLLYNSKRSRQNKFDRFREAFNKQIELNETNFIRGDTVMESNYDNLTGYNRELVEMAKEIAKDPEYKFQRLPVFRKSAEFEAIYVNKAHELNRYTLSQIKGGKLRLRVMYTDKLYQLSSDIFLCCYRANGIYPTCQDEYLDREAYLEQALDACRYYERLLFKYFGKAHVDEEHQNRWSEKYDSCNRLIRAVIKSDKSRFGKLKPKEKNEC